MMGSKTFSIIMATMAILMCVGDAFVPTTITGAISTTIAKNGSLFSDEISLRKSCTEFSMVGGRGWDNNDYLSALSGDDDERKKSSEDYQEFSDRRKAFDERQKELMKNPQARAFMEQRQNSMMRQPQSNDDDIDDFSIDDPFAKNIQPGSGGGSRMAQMMARAERMQRGMGGGGPNFGMEQKLFDLDGDDEDGSNE